MELKNEQGQFIRLRIDDEKLYKVLDELGKASRILRDCVMSLVTMGIVENKKRACPCNEAVSG